MSGVLHRYAAFTTNANGGNPAGIWIGESLPPEAEMQRIAAGLGYPETIFVSPARGLERKVRYYAPTKEMDFCGHATIATGVLFGETLGAGDYRIETKVGEVPLNVRRRNGRWEASLTSVTPRHEPAPAELLAEALAALRWREDEIDPALGPARIFAGNWHLLIAARTAERLAALDYDFERMKALMLADGLATLQLARPAGKPLAKWLQWSMLGLGGFVHGLFGTGGPMIVYVVRRRLADKRAFRSTLAVLWLVLNIGLLSKFALAGWSDALHPEEKAHGVHVGLVLPGFVVTEGFPQRELTGNALTRWAVSTPDKVAGAIMVAGPGGKAERYVPRPYWLAAAARIIAPRLVRRGASAKALTPEIRTRD